MPWIIDGIGTIAADYDTWLCDVWGVVHNGVAPYEGAVEAMAAFRRVGGTVILLTNAPRPSPPVVAQLDHIGVPREAYDRVLSSGDVMRHVIGRLAGAKVFFLGPEERDRSLVDGLPVAFTTLEDAELVLCTGLMDDTTETPDDYDAMLREMRGRGLTFYCANPDRVVQKGDRLLFCAGALAQQYQFLGGEVVITGKPDHFIYDEALALSEEVRGRPTDRDRVLAIGDGIDTDMRGAAQYGIDALFIAGGIHAAELEELAHGHGHAIEPLMQRLAASAPSLRLVGIMPGLRW